MHPLEASRALKRISAHIQMADGARVPGVRMVADGAWVRVDIVDKGGQGAMLQGLLDPCSQRQSGSHIESFFRNPEQCNW